MRFLNFFKKILDKGNIQTHTNETPETHAEQSNIQTTFEIGPIYSYSDEETEIYNLNKLATEHKTNKRLDLAIETLKTIYDKRKKYYGYKDVEVNIRLALFLQQANMFEESITYLNEFREYKRNDLNDMSKVEDKTRLMLQREKRYKEAITHGILSYIYKLINLDQLINEMKKIDDYTFRDLRKQLKEDLSLESINNMLTPLLTKAKETQNKEQYNKIITYHLKKFPPVNLEQLKNDLKKLE
ncbi:hypothetical protein [Brevibacillus laterosporus]|uniref:hypothetical protein n=1 Tax=Brevibacillus laterosporus TaxID=1465 RepID=UPI0018F8A5BE|nr:hypothetical protein [Brevibacillus laterosporus]MBG9772381.1 hypothetical protein [Brevibacillus laterosporus]